MQTKLNMAKSYAACKLSGRSWRQSDQLTSDSILKFNCACCLPVTVSRYLWRPCHAGSPAFFSWESSCVDYRSCAPGKEVYHHRNLYKPLAFHCSGTARESMTLCAKTWGKMMKYWPSSNISSGLHPVSTRRAFVHTYGDILSLGKFGKVPPFTYTLIHIFKYKT